MPMPINFRSVSLNCVKFSFYGKRYRLVELIETQADDERPNRSD